MNRDSTLGLNPQRLARLVGITLNSERNAEREHPAQSTSELIQAHLVGTLLFDATMIDDLPAFIGRSEKGRTPRSGKTLGDALMDPKSEIDIIRKVRRYAKRTASSNKSEITRAVAVTVYFAAIANALVFHDVRITTNSFESLKGSFDNLAKKPWMPPSLAGLFRRACEAC